MRRFELHRDEDVSGVSGTGIVAEGVAFSDGGPVALRWTSEWPTSVVFHDRGVESLEAVHGHNGRTRIVWLDVPQVDYDEGDRSAARQAVADALCGGDFNQADRLIGLLDKAGFCIVSAPVAEAGLDAIYGRPS